MKSAQYRHKDTQQQLHGWVKGVMADTLTWTLGYLGAEVRRGPWSIRPLLRKSTPGPACCRAVARAWHRYGTVLRMLTGLEGTGL